LVSKIASDAAIGLFVSAVVFKLGKGVATIFNNVKSVISGVGKTITGSGKGLAATEDIILLRMIATNTAIIAGEGGIKPNVPLPNTPLKTGLNFAKNAAKFVPAVAIGAAAVAALEYFGSRGPTYAQGSPQSRLQFRSPMPLGKTTVNLTLHSRSAKSGR
jgi:hypothetical protein